MLSLRAIVIVLAAVAVHCDQSAENREDTGLMSTRTCSTRTITVYEGDNVSLPCSYSNTPTSRYIMIWLDHSGRWVCLGRTNNYGARATLTFNHSARQYDLRLNNVQQNYNGHVFSCGAFVYYRGWYWYSRYRLNVLPRAAQTADRSCHSFSFADQGCRTNDRYSCNTMCAAAADCSRSEAVVCGPVSNNDKNTILRAHNSYRQRIACGQEGRAFSFFKGQPAGTNINEMRWNDELASTAQRWAEQQIWQHDCPYCRKSDNFRSQGQNIGYGGSSSYGWQQVIESWYNQVGDYNYYINISRPFKSIYKYKNVIWATTKYVGCGTYKSSRSCSWISSSLAHRTGCQMYVCNYYPSASTGRPYSRYYRCSRYSSQYRDLCSW